MIAELETAIRSTADAFRLAGTADAGLTITAARLQMEAHYLFERTRHAFLAEGASDVDRIFGVNTENEMYYYRTESRIGRLTHAQQGQLLAAIGAARRLADGLERLPPAERVAEALRLVAGFEAVAQRICRLGPPVIDKRTEYLTRRPALR